MKKLKQLCNDFGDDSVLESPPNRRNRPSSTPSPSANVGQQMFYQQLSRGHNITMDQRAMMQAVQMGQLHHLQQQAIQQQLQQHQQQQQRSQPQHAQKRQVARNHCPSGMNRSPMSPHSHESRPQLFGSKRPELAAAACHGNVRPQFRPTEVPNTNSAALSNNKTARAGTPLRPAHTGPNPYFVDYSASNPLANGYDEPLELTTKKSRDRKVAEEQPHHRPPATFLKIPTLMKP
jgi:transcription initiation factor TFIID subunit TAF12